MPDPTPRARFVSFAGLDGAGKTTQARLLGARLAALGLRTVVEAPPGPSFVRRVLSDLAADSGADSYLDVLGADTTRLLSAFVRYRDWTTSVVPALRSAQFVVTDRFAACHYASVRALNGSNEELIRAAFRALPVPDLTLFLEVPPEVAERRVATRGVDHQDLDFLRSYDRAYRSLPEFAGFVRVDGVGTVTDVAARIHDQVRVRWPELRPDAGGSATDNRPGAAPAPLVSARETG